MTEWLTVNDIQKILKMGRRQTYQLVNQPDFPKVKIGKSIRVPQDKFEKFMEHILYTEYELKAV